MSSNWSEYLEAAITAAKDAGALIKAGFYREKNITFKDVTDMVTETDRQCESTIIEYLRSKFPDHKFLGEEV